MGSSLHFILYIHFHRGPFHIILHIHFHFTNNFQHHIKHMLSLGTAHSQLNLSCPYLYLGVHSISYSTSTAWGVHSTSIFLGESIHIMPHFQWGVYSSSQELYILLSTDISLPVLHECRGSLPLKAKKRQNSGTNQLHVFYFVNLFLMTLALKT